MELTETKLSGRTVYHGRIVDIHMDEVRLPNGKTSQREVVEHPGGVVILPLDERMQIITAVSYTHLDLYKRQLFIRLLPQKG